MGRGILRWIVLALLIGGPGLTVAIADGLGLKGDIAKALARQTETPRAIRG